MNRPRSLIAAALLASFLVLLGLSQLGSAESRTRGAEGAPAGPPAASDIHVTGGMVTILDDVDGNLTAHAGFLNIVGDVHGSVIAVAGRAEIRGRIAGSVRSVGGLVAIYGRVDGDVRAAGGVVTIVEGASVGGNVVAAGAWVTIVDGARVAGNINGLAVETSIEGRVGGDVELAVHRLTLTDGARIRGNLRYRSGDPAVELPGAVVAGVTERLDPGAGIPGGDLLFWRQAAIPRTLLMLGTGAALVVLLPRRTIAVADRLRRAPWDALVVGAGVALFGPLALALLSITVVGLPIALVGSALFLGLVYASQVFVGIAVGKSALRSGWRDARRGANLLVMAGGVTALAGIRLLPVPHLDLLLGGLMACLALGAVATVLIGGRLPLGDRPPPG